MIHVLFRNKLTQMPSTTQRSRARPHAHAQGKWVGAGAKLGAVNRGPRETWTHVRIHNKPLPTKTKGILTHLDRSHLHPCARTDAMSLSGNQSGKWAVARPLLRTRPHGLAQREQTRRTTAWVSRCGKIATPVGKSVRVSD